jgi:hypothetical protein
MPGDRPAQLLAIEDCNDPVSYRYEIRTPFGYVAQVMSVDIRIFISDPTTYAKIGWSLFANTIATAISRYCYLDMMWQVRWKTSVLGYPAPPITTIRGRQWGTPAGRAHCPIVQQDTGHGDGYSLRAITLPGTPVGWQRNGMLTEGGWDSLMAWAHGLRMGLAGAEIGGDLQHLIAYPYLFPPTPGNLSGTFLRRVTHLRVLQYTDKAPDFTSGLWP